MNIKRSLFYFLYVTIGRRLPPSYAPYSLGLYKLRMFFIRHAVVSCGSGLLVEPNVHLSPHIEIGHNVYIHENVRIRTRTTIGGDVLIASGVQMITVNHPAWH